MASVFRKMIPQITTIADAVTQMMQNLGLLRQRASERAELPDGGLRGVQPYRHRGRMGIYELLTVDDGIRRLIHDHTSEQALREYAAQQEMTSLKEDGVHLVRQGENILAEVLRVASKWSKWKEVRKAAHA